MFVRYIFYKNMTYDLNDYKYATMNICRYKGWDNCNVEKVWLLLIEEIGELAGSIRRHHNVYKDKKKVKIEDELGDVFSYLFQIAGMLDIDLNKMWQANQAKSLNKKYFKDNKLQYNNESHCGAYSQYRTNRAENRGMVQHSKKYANCQ
jgi:NTP pyrophosphatase (non-canonical NTP hydrolase)